MISPERVGELAEEARQEGCEVEIVDDLCELMQEGDEQTMNRIGGGRFQEIVA